MEGSDRQKAHGPLSRPHRGPAKRQSKPCKHPKEPEAAAVGDGSPRPKPPNVEALESSQHDQPDNAQAEIQPVGEEQ